jgi:hypothetical protein
MTTLPIALERFLDGVRTGDWTGMEQHFTPDAIHDGSMPGWRLQYEGPSRIVQEYQESWTPGHGWDIQDYQVHDASSHVMIEMESTHGSMADGSLRLCRMANIFELRDGRIAAHRYYCCGEWNAATVRQIDAEAPKAQRLAPTV